MASATLTAVTPGTTDVATFTTVPGTLYAIGATGTFGNGARVSMEYALGSAESVFAPVPGGDFMGGGNLCVQFLAPGTKLRFRLASGTAGTSSVNVDVTAAV